MPLLPTVVGPPARRLGMDPARLEGRLDAMADERLLLDLPDARTATTMSRLAPHRVGSFERHQPASVISRGMLVPLVGRRPGRESAASARRRIAGRVLSSETEAGG